MSAQPASHFATIQGTLVHYHELGAGPALLLLHGSGPGATGWSNYSRNADILARHFRVIIPDYPGFGQSDMKPADARVPGWWADIMIGLLDHVGIDKAHVVGNSMGGMITLKMALEYPNRLARLILMGPGGGQSLFTTWPTAPIINLTTCYDGHGPTPEKVRQFVQDCLYDQSLITEELMSARLAAAMDPRIVAQPPMRVGPGGPPEDLWRDPRMARLPHDVLITWGREDRVIPLDAGLTLMRQIPKARFFVFPHCGHWAQWEQPEEFNRVTLSFLGAAS